MVPFGSIDSLIFLVPLVPLGSIGSVRFIEFLWFPFLGFLYIVLLVTSVPLVSEFLWLLGFRGSITILLDPGVPRFLHLGYRLLVVSGVP